MIIPLTADQQFALEPVFDDLRSRCEAGQPGMLIAQVRPTDIEIEQISHEQAIQMLRAMGRSIAVIYRYGTVICHE